ncbi:LysR family transcriptional regulator substrate-binding protein [Terrilactibacillus sp. S3-3]|nr:LysR family transcriptional regulator substrate-binding protein [Terrilactibacillus sp. S3-3]
MDSFRKIGVEPNILCKSGDIHSILDWANIGLGVGLIPKPPVDFLRFANMQYRDIMDRSLATKIAVIWLKGTYLSAATKSFIKATVDESERDKLSRLFK